MLSNLRLNKGSEGPNAECQFAERVKTLVLTQPFDASTPINCIAMTGKGSL